MIDFLRQLLISFKPYISEGDFKFALNLYLEAAAKQELIRVLIDRTPDGERAIYEELWKDLDARLSRFYLARNKSKQASILRLVILDHIALINASSIFTSKHYDPELTRAFIALVSGIIEDDAYEREKISTIRIHVFRMWILVSLKMLYQNYFDKHLSLEAFDDKFSRACRVCCYSYFDNVLRSAAKEFKAHPPVDWPDDEFREIALNKTLLDISIPLEGLRTAVEKGDIQAIDLSYAQFRDGVLSLPDEADQYGLPR